MWRRHRVDAAAVDDRERMAIAVYEEQRALHLQLCTIISEARRLAEARERLDRALRRTG